MAPGLVVDDRRVLLVRLGGVLPRRVLQLRDRVGRPHVFFAAHAPGVLAPRIQHRLQHRIGVIERGLVYADRLFGDFEHAHAFDRRGGAGEILVHERPREAHRLEDLRTSVGHVGRSAHLRHHLLQALADRLHEILDRLSAVEIRAELALCRKIEQRLEGEIRMHRFGAVASEQGKVVHLAHGARFHDETRARAQTLPHQVLMDRRQRQKRRDSHAFPLHEPVGNHDNRVARAHRILGLCAKRREARLDRLLAPRQGVGDVQLERAELAAGVALDVPDFLHFEEVEHRLRYLEPERRVHLVDAEQVRFRSDERHQRRHQLLADRVDRRVRDLREQLFEVVVQRLVLVRQHGKRRVVAHRADGFLAVRRHRDHDELDVLLRVAEGLLAIEHPHRTLQRRGLFGLDLVKLDADALDPFRVGFRARKRVLELFVVDDPTLLQIDEEHPAWLQAPLFDDFLLGHRQAAAFRPHDHEVVRRDDVTRGPQAVPVERRAYLAPVCKRNRGGSVPRLHHGGVVFVECAPRRVHQRVVLPSLGDHHHHRVRD